MLSFQFLRFRYMLLDSHIYLYLHAHSFARSLAYTSILNTCNGLDLTTAKIGRRCFIVLVLHTHTSTARNKAANNQKCAHHRFFLMICNSNSNNRKCLRKCQIMRSKSQIFTFECIFNTHVVFWQTTLCALLLVQRAGF